ncbi:MAG: LytTR family DNA-binding domain-containing protein [Ginsengibacter sp.]
MIYQRPLVVRSSLKAIEIELPDNKFIRIHKSYWVSVAEITAVRKNSVFIKEMELPVGETYPEVIEKIIN